VHPDDNDPRSRRDLCRRKPHASADLDDRQDPAAKIRNATYVLPRLGNTSDLGNADHFPNLTYRDAKLLPIQGEGDQVQLRPWGRRLRGGGEPLQLVGEMEQLIHASLAPTRGAHADIR
jgi:hypothetical protein